MKGLRKMSYSATNPDQGEVHWSNVPRLGRCACRKLTTGRAKNLKTGKTVPMCGDCARQKGYADTVR